MSDTATRRRGQSGQALVLMVGVLLASIALLALIIDGGNVFAQQRVTQNGSDGAAEAGAIVLAERLAGSAEPAGGWDARVNTRITGIASANNLTVKAAYYTDICGIPLKADGTAALHADGTEDLASALRVGNVSGALPAGSATTPDCPSRTVGPVAGVLLLGERNVQPFVARAIGISNIPVGTRATAVAGYLQGYCDSSQGQYCAILPVTIPVNAITCDGNHRPVDTGFPWTFYTVYKVPLCSNAPGDIGWLDWTPTSGGISELIDSIQTPNNPAIDLPSWQYVTQTGNVNSSGVESALRAYDGQVVLIPQFDLTCNPPNGVWPDSTEPAITTGPNFGCPAGYLGANGQNEWYRMPSFAYFELCTPSNPDCNGLHGAYVNGNNQAVCDTGNGASSCLIGKFVDTIGAGTVGPGVGSGTGSKALGVQLIK